MQPGYSPYAAHRQESRFHLPRLSGGLKKWLVVIVGVFTGLFILFYLWLGPLRFFVNHYLGLTFFAKNYLILLQNNYELRPGGGFITAYGNLDTLMGVPTNLEFHNSYDIDTKNYIKPPFPQEEFLKNEWYQGYTFRDANWEPNFPESARELADFYQKKFQGRDVDGIIVVNFSLIEKLVEAFGGIEVNGKELTDKTLFKELEFEVNNVDRHNEEILTERKDVLSVLAETLMNKIKWNPAKTKRVILEALREKDLYLWFKSERLERRLVSKEWGNRLELPEASDFLAVNLANLGAKKADRYMLREMHAHVNLAKEVPEVTVEVTLRFPGFLNSYSDHYKGYLRLYVPGGATVKESPIESAIDRAGDLNVISTKIVLPAGSKTTLNYSYNLPRTLLNTDEYRLKLVKQSGNSMDVTVTVETSADTTIASKEFTVFENRAVFKTALKADQTLVLSVLPDTTPPYPIEQFFTDLNTVEIHWSEPLNSGAATDLAHFQVRDLNVKDPTTDTVGIASAELVTPSVLKLKLEGITTQELERYELTLADIRDLSGNGTLPNPKVITTVQRYKAAEVAEPKEE